MYGKHADVAAAKEEHELSWKDSLWLATLGGAAALGLEGVVGSFQVGKEFDALLVDAGGGHGFDGEFSMSCSLLQKNGVPARLECSAPSCSFSQLTPRCRGAPYPACCSV